MLFIYGSYSLTLSLPFGFFFYIYLMYMSFYYFYFIRAHAPNWLNFNNRAIFSMKTFNRTGNIIAYNTIPDELNWNLCFLSTGHKYLPIKSTTAHVMWRVNVNVNVKWEIRMYFHMGKIKQINWTKTVEKCFKWSFSLKTFWYVAPIRIYGQTNTETPIHLWYACTKYVYIFIHIRIQRVKISDANNDIGDSNY